MPNPELEIVLKELAGFMLEASPRVTNGGRHVKICWRIAGRPERVVVVAATPSDWRGPANARAVTRRYLRADAAQPKLPPPRRPRVPRPKPVAPPKPFPTKPKPVAPPPQPVPVRTIADEHLSPTAAAIWQQLFYDRPVKLSALAAALQKKASTLAVALNGLKRRGIVKNLPDRRGWLKAALP